MMPLDYKMRTLLLRYATKLIEDKIDNLDSQFTENFQAGQVSELKIEPFHFKENTSLRPEFIANLNSTVSENKKRIKEFITDYERQYYAAHKILAAQKSFALHQRHMLQIPTTTAALWQFIKQSFHFRMIYTWFSLELWWYWLKNLFWPKKHVNTVNEQ